MITIPIRSTRPLLYSTVGVLLGLLAAWAAWSWLGTHSAPREPIRISSNGAFAETTPEERIRQAELVVQGVVGQPQSSRWSTPSGELPPGTTSTNISPSLVIYTDYPLSVDRVLKGSAPSDTVLVRVLGGTVGQDSMQADYSPELQPGDRVIMLLSPDDDPTIKDLGPKHYTTIGSFQGLYKLVGTQATNPVHTLSVTELIAMVQQSQR